MDTQNQNQNLITTAPTPPPSSTSHRRIELQSPADLTHLKNAAARAARAKLDLHLPLESALRDSGSGVDSVRAAVEEAVGGYIERVFGMVGGNVSVNGVEGERVRWEREVPEEFEPYDAALASRIQALYGEVERLNLELAERRREAVRKAAEKWREGFERQTGEVDGAMEAGEVSARAAEGVGLEGVVGVEGREGEVRRVWEEGLQGLGRLRSGMGETRARGEEAQKLVEFLERS